MCVKVVPWLTFVCISLTLTFHSHAISGAYIIRSFDVVNSNQDSLPALHTIREEELASIQTSFEQGTITVGLKSGETYTYHRWDWDYEDYYPELNQRLKDSLKKIEITFTRAEHEPEFPGGQDALEKYVRGFCVQHADHIPKGKPVEVTLRFIVHIHGQVTDVEVLPGSENTGLNQIAIQCLQLSPPWIPGAQNGHQISCYKTQVIKLAI